VRTIFSLAVAGKSSVAIRDYLNDNKVLIPSEYNKQNKVAGKDTHYVLTPHGIWNSSKILRILRNYTYTGAMVLGKSKSIMAETKKTISVPRSEQYVTENTHEAIVTRDDFITAQERIRVQAKSKTIPHTYPLKKKIRCGYCHRIMFCDTKGSEERMCCAEGIRDVKHSLCSSEKYPLRGIENAVLKRLKELFTFFGRVKTKAKKERENIEEKNKKLNTLKADTDLRIGEAQKKKAELYERYAEGKLTREEYETEKVKADNQIEGYNDAVKREEEKLRTINLKEIPLDVQPLINQMDGYRSIKALTQEVVKIYIDCLYVYSAERLDIRFRYQDEIKKTARLFGIHTALFKNLQATPILESEKK